MHKEYKSTSFEWLSLVIGVIAIAAGVAGALLVTRIHSLALYLLMLAGIVLLIATVWKIEWGLFTLIAITYARISDVAVHFYGAPSIAQPFIVLLAGLLFLRWMLAGEKPVGWFRPAVTIMAYGAVIFLSLFYASDATRAQEGFLTFFKDTVIAILLIMLIQSKAYFRVAAWGFNSIGILLGSIAIYQYLTGTFTNPYWGLAESEVMNIISGVEGYRIMGTYGDPNFFAQIMVVIIPIALNRLIFEKHMILKVLAAWALAASFLTVVFTFSRGGFLALCMVLGLLVLWRKPPLVAVLSAILILIMLIPFLPPTYFERLETILEYLPFRGADVRSEVSFRGRMSEYAVGFQMFQDNPILGIGYENYPVYYLDYSMKLGLDPRRTERSAHSLYLEVIAEQGLVGFLLFGYVLFSTFTSLGIARRTFKKIAMDEFSDLALAFQIGFLGYLTAALFIHGAYPRNLWLLIGIGLSAQQMAKNEEEILLHALYKKRLEIGEKTLAQKVGER